MQFSREQPEIFDRCAKVFNIKWKDGVIITYGDTIYCKYPLSFGKQQHEHVHIDQQAEYGVEAWWDKYLTDKQFRLDQEVEAYKKEIKYIRNKVKDYVLKNRLIDSIKDLSSPMYGTICTKEQAEVLLK